MKLVKPFIIGYLSDFIIAYLAQYYVMMNRKHYNKDELNLIEQSHRKYMYISPLLFAFINIGVIYVHNMYKIQLSYVYLVASLLTTLWKYNILHYYFNLLTVFISNAMVWFIIFTIQKNI